MKWSLVGSTKHRRRALGQWALGVNLALVSALALVSSPTSLWAAKRPAKSAETGHSVPGGGLHYNPDHETVELFAAIEAGKIGAKFIVSDSTKGRVFLENKTDRPLNVRLPDAFGGVPALAQFGGPGGFPGGGNRGGGNQNVGGGANGNRGGFFNIAAEKVGEFKVTCVCLEHGKPNPRAAVPYRLVPIDEVTNDPAVKSLVATLSGDDCDQRAAQAAAWHLANDLSWQELAAKRVEHLVGPSEPYFIHYELKAARELVERATADSAPAKTPEASLSQR